MYSKKIIILTGKYVLFCLKSLKAIQHFPHRSYEILKQMKRIGYDSIPLVLITSAFTGLVTALQASYQTKGYIPKSLIGVLVGKTTMTELAPVLTALVLTGRIGASMAAEIGTMKVSEQLDAVEVMAVNPYEFLYMPRMLSGIIMIPLLTILANLIAIISAFIFSVYSYDISFYMFFDNMKAYFMPMDLWVGVSKALVFGFIITSIGCFSGANTEGGAEGVGVVTTDTVVYSSIGVLMMDFFVAKILFGGMSL